MTEGRAKRDLIGRDRTRCQPLVTPSTVKAVISKIETAQLKRAQEDISIQLSDILGNVNGVIKRFQEDLGSDLKGNKKSRGEREKGKKRFVLLEKIASFSKAAETKEKNLYEILNWMSDWGDSLSYEIKPKECDKQDEWVEVMERVLPLSLIATEGGIESLISLCSNLIEDQKKRTIRPKGNFWKAWREKILHKSSISLQPLSPEQMLQDENTTNAKIAEVRAMLQELLDFAIFNKGEIKAIKYMSTMVENLNQALILQFQENHKMEIQYRLLEVEMSKEINKQKLLFQKELQVLEDMKNALEMQVQASEQKYQQLLQEETTMRYQLQMGGGKRDRRDFTEYVSSPLKSQTSQNMSLPTTEEGLETEMEQKPEEMVGQSSLEEEKEEEEKKEEEEREEKEEAAQLFSNTQTKDMAVDMGDDFTPFLKQLLPKMNLYPEHSEDLGIHAENAIVSKYKVTALKPTGYRGTDDIYSEKREEVDKSTVWINEEDSDVSRESWGDLPTKMSPKEKTGLPQEEQAEEERHWQKRRKEWQAEEKRWQEQQKKWKQLEKEHKEKQRQWKLQEEELYKKMQEYIDYSLLMKQRRELDEQKLEQNKEPFMSLSPTTRRGMEVKRVYQTQLAREKFQTSMIYESQLPSVRTFGSQGAHQGSMKMGPFSCIGMSFKSFPCPFPSKSSTFERLISLPKEKKYYLDVLAQRKNLLLLSEAAESMGIPVHLHSLARKLIIETLYTNVARFWYLIQKYSTYRTFQCLRQEVSNHIEARQITGNVDDAQNFNIFLEKIDKYESRRLQIWTEKQKVLEQDRGDCLEQMMSLFSQLREEWDLNLSAPILITTLEKQKKTATITIPKKHTHFIRTGGTHPKQPPMAKHQEYLEFLKIARQRGIGIESIWKTDLSTSSYPVQKKTPASVIWSQIGGYPDFPRMVELDIHSPCHKCLEFLRTRSPTIFKRKSIVDRDNELIHEEPTESVSEI
ncbi:protein FAM186B isoform X1 [Antechinus flavipes]|uniref:protein FAM186B isoform X1 n=1 Tax=Antechinus flavipes TaxID=38775 RepID=UPI002235EE54|nr:protein FAM186B isoform X1 [Antechinus flavipes]